MGRRGRGTDDTGSVEDGLRWSGQAPERSTEDLRTGRDWLTGSCARGEDSRRLLRVRLSRPPACLLVSLARACSRPPEEEPARGTNKSYLSRRRSAQARAESATRDTAGMRATQDTPCAQTTWSLGCRHVTVAFTRAYVSTDRGRILRNRVLAQARCSRSYVLPSCVSPRDQSCPWTQRRPDFANCFRSGQNRGMH